MTQLKGDINDMKKYFFIMTIIIFISFFLLNPVFSAPPGRFGLLLEDETGDISYIYKLIFPATNITISSSTGTMTSTPSFTSLEIIGGSGVNEFTIVDSTTDFLTVNPDNSITSGRHILIKAIPEAASSIAVVEIEAGGINWGSGSSVLKLVSGDADTSMLRCYYGLTQKFNVAAAGSMWLTGDIQLIGGGTLTTSVNGDLTLLPNNAGITIIGDAGSTAHNLNLNDDLFVTGRIESKGAAYLDSTLDVSDDIIAYTGINFAVDAEASDDYVVTLGTIGSYTAGLIVYFDALHANVGACTLDVNSIGAKSLKSLHDQDPANDYIEARSIVHCIYDGSAWQILSPDCNP